MTSILASISGSFSRALILGTFFPVTLFALCGLLFVVPFLPGDVALLTPLAQLDPGWKMALVTLVIVLFTGLLYNLNVALIRLYEGYPWRKSWLGERATERQRAKLEWAISRRELLRDLVPALGEADPSHPALEKLKGWRPYLGHRVRNEFPDASLVLPTRLGNVIRSFEEYPRSVYGISAVSVWPRLSAVVDKEYRPLLDESKASLDFTINGSFLSGLLSASILVAGLLVPERIDWVPWTLEVSLAALASRLFYVASIGQAAAWGVHVKAAFDLFRWDLLAKLGYQWSGIRPEAEQDLWTEISTRMIYGNPPEGVTLTPYARPSMPDLLRESGVSL